MGRTLRRATLVLTAVGAGIWLTVFRDTAPPSVPAPRVAACLEPPLPPVPRALAWSYPSTTVACRPLEEWVERGLTVIDEDRVDVTAAPAFVEGRPVIAFTLRNTMPQSLLLSRASLPWSGPCAVDAVALTYDDRASGRTASCGTWQRTPVVGLRPGEAISGTCDLASIPELAARVREREVKVFWRYTLGLGIDDVRATSGVVVFKRVR